MFASSGYGKNDYTSSYGSTLPRHTQTFQIAEEDVGVKNFLDIATAVFKEADKTLHKELLNIYTKYQTTLAGKPVATSELDRQKASDVNDNPNIEQTPITTKPTETTPVTDEDKRKAKKEYDADKQKACQEFKDHMHEKFRTLMNDLVKDLPVLGKKTVTEFLRVQKKEGDILSMAKCYSNKDAQTTFLQAYRTLYEAKASELMELDGIPTEPAIIASGGKEKEKAAPKDPKDVFVANKVLESQGSQAELARNSNALLAKDKKLEDLLHTYAYKIAGLVETGYNLEHQEKKAPEPYDYKKIIFAALVLAVQTAAVCYTNSNDRLRFASYALTGITGIVGAINVVSYMKQPAGGLLIKIEQNYKAHENAATALTTDLKDIVAGTAGSRGHGSGSIMDVVKAMIECIPENVFARVLSAKREAKFRSNVSFDLATEAGIFEPNEEYSSSRS